MTLTDWYQLMSDQAHQDWSLLLYGGFAVTFCTWRTKPCSTRLTTESAQRHKWLIIRLWAYYNVDDEVFFYLGIKKISRLPSKWPTLSALRSLDHHYHISTTTNFKPVFELITLKGSKALLHCPSLQTYVWWSEWVILTFTNCRWLPMKMLQGFGQLSS